MAPRRDRGHPRPLERRPPRFDRRPARGRRPDRAGRAAERRQVVAPPGPVRDPDQDRRLPVHDAAAGSGADADRRRARPARRDPRAHRWRRRRPRRRPGAARRPPHGRRDRLLRPGRRRSGRARVVLRRGRSGRHRQAGHPRRDARRRGRSGSHRAARGARSRTCRSCACLDPRRAIARRVPRGGLGADRPDPGPAAQRRRRSTTSLWRSSRDRPSRTSPTGSTTTSPRPSSAHGSGDRRRGSTASASAGPRVADGDVVEIVT